MNLFVAAFLVALQGTPAPSPPPAAPSSATPQPSPAATQPARPLAVSVSAVALAPGQSQTIAVTNAAGSITASVDTPIVTIAIDQNARTIVLTAAQQTGNAVLTVSDQSGTSLTVPVRVAYAAATVPASVTLRITGNPVDPAWIQREVQRAILQNTSLQPGVSAESLQIDPYTLPPMLQPGASAAIPITIHVPGGTQYLDVAQTVTLSMQNVGADPFLPPLLLYDDDPEKITADGVLYRAHVNPNAPARLYYYHQNTGDVRRLLVVLTPAGSDASTVQLIDSSAGPNIDVMSVGHAVTRDFLVEKPRNEGIVADVAGGPLPIDDFPAMQPLDGAAGSVGIRILSGGPVTVTVLAVPQNATNADIAAALSGPKLPGDGHNRTGVFDISTFAQTSLAYSVGGADATIDYGASTPPASGTQTGHDYGEYGVLRTLTFDITNSTSAPATLYLYERPLGGVVRSSFLIDDQLAQVGCVRVPQRYEVGQPLSVNAGASRIVVQTMTDGGSNYPLEVGLTATPPLPTTPPISAPDGCFPKPESAAPLPSPSPSPAPEPTGL